MGKARNGFLEALLQVLIGPRGILKMGHIWLPLSLILAGGTPIAPGARLSISLYLLLAVVCKGLSSILVNDLTDKEIDAAAGKKRWIVSLPSPAGVSIPVILLAAAALALVLAGGQAAVLAAFSATALLGVLYSLKPVRFKDRGWWGPMAYGLSAALLHGLVPWSLFRPALILLPLLLAVVLADKLAQILFHQISDLEADKAMKVGSWAAAAGRGRAGRTLRLVVSIALTADGAVLLYLLFTIKGHPLHFWLIVVVSVLGVAASWLYVKVVAKKRGASTELTEALPWPYLGMSYVLFYALPPLMLSVLARLDPRMWVLVALSALWLLGRSFNYLFYDPKK